MQDHDPWLTIFTRAAVWACCLVFCLLVWYGVVLWVIDLLREGGEP